MNRPPTFLASWQPWHCCRTDCLFEYLLLYMLIYLRMLVLLHQVLTRTVVVGRLCVMLNSSGWSKRSKRGTDFFLFVSSTSTQFNAELADAFLTKGEVNELTELAFKWSHFLVFSDSSGIGSEHCCWNVLTESFHLSGPHLEVLSDSSGVGSEHCCWNVLTESFHLSGHTFRFYLTVQELEVNTAVGMYSLRAFIWVDTPLGFIWQFRSWKWTLLLECTHWELSFEWSHL